MSKYENVLTNTLSINLTIILHIHIMDYDKYKVQFK